MKRFLTQAAVAALLTVSLMACLNDPEEDGGHEEGHGLVVMVRDSAGALVAADSVHWSLAGDALHKAAHGTPDDTVKHGATRVNDSGSIWEIADPLHGSFHIRAELSRRNPEDTLCGFTGYTVAPFHADSIADTVTLTLNVREVCI